MDSTKKVVTIKACRRKLTPITPITPIKKRVIKPIIKKKTQRPATPPATFSEDDSDDDDDLLSFPLVDLRKHAGLSDGACHNNTIVEALNALIKVTIALKAGSSGSEKTRHTRRLGSFIKGRDAIKDYSKKIETGAQAQKEIGGVGKGIATRIQEFLDTGTLEELEQAISPETRTIMDLTSITGIGEVKAKALMDDYGVTSVDDLVQKYKSGKVKIARNQLTHHIAVGLEYYADLQRMSWSEADKISKKIHAAIASVDNQLFSLSCGSYRRKKKSCGDLDVLVSHPTGTPDDDYLPRVVKELEDKGILVGHLTTHGKTKYMGVCKLLPASTGRRVDIRFVEWDSLGAATLYFTGSGKFNKIMRYHANVRGYTLNEYGLFDYTDGVKGTRIPAQTEEDIFKVLNFKYLKPTEREF